MPSHKIANGQIVVKYRPFTNYSSACGCGECFNVITWVEKGPEEKAAAQELADLLYQILQERPRNVG